MFETPLVELVDVSKTYRNGVHALDGFNLELKDGEFVSLLGSSGCGKSTALRIIAGLSDYSRGQVRRAWEGQSRRESERAAQPVACVFQEPTLLPWTSVWNNAFLPLRLQGITKRQAASRVEEALALVGLAQFARAYPGELSGGMTMRASVARALVTEPRLLLLDEPFAALDEITRSRLNDDLLALWRERRWAGLFITHSVFESVYLSQRVLVMSPRPGRVVEEITIDLPERTEESRTSPRYIELCRRVSQSLQRATSGAVTSSTHG